MAVKFPLNFVVAGACLLGILVTAGLSEDKPKADPKLPTPSVTDPRVTITPRLRTPANTATEELDRRSSIRVDSTLVLIPVSVTDRLEASSSFLLARYSHVFGN